jgi:hypothetical protein
MACNALRTTLSSAWMIWLRSNTPSGGWGRSRDPPASAVPRRGSAHHVLAHLYVEPRLGRRTTDPAMESTSAVSRQLR